jgi:hypothetical protein
MNSMLYTMGTALNRAAEHGFEVRVLVDGAWLEGQVAASDGVGVVLESSAGQHCVVRTERIAAVQIDSESPLRPSISAASEAVPMPGPQPSYASSYAY